MPGFVIVDFKAHPGVRKRHTGMDCALNQTLKFIIAELKQNEKHEIFLFLFRAFVIKGFFTIQKEI
jgi:hypothetical protein